MRCLLYTTPFNDSPKGMSALRPMLGGAVSLLLTVSLASQASADASQAQKTTDAAPQSIALGAVGKERKARVSATAQAQDDAQASARNTLEETVVTGTRTEQAAIDSPVKVEVINAATIDRQHARDLAEALKSAPGIQLHPVTGKEGQEVWLQGIGADRVLVLMDSEPVAPSTGSSVDVTQISVADVQRIEIVKGATSVLYGSNAIGGVVNVITASPDEGWHGRLSFDLGSFGDQNPSGDPWQLARQRANAQVTYGGDFVDFSAGVNARFTDGFQVEPDSLRMQGQAGHKINSHLNVGFTLDDNSEYVLGYERYDQKLRGLIPFTRPGQPVRGVFKTDDVVRERFTGRGTWLWDDGEAIFRVYDENFQNDSMPDGLATRNANLKSFKSGIQINQNAWSNQVWTIGVDYFKEDLDQFVSSRPEPEVNDGRESIEVYVQDEIALGNLTLLPGARWQTDTDVGQHAVPAVNGRYDFLDDGDWRVFMRGGVGQGYRVANLKERFFIFDHSQIGYVIQGNPDLTPESSISYQLGFVVANLNDFQVDVNLFRNDLTDLIDTQIVGFDNESVNPHVIYSYTNVNKARTQGVEVSAQYWPINSLAIVAGYQYLDSDNFTTGFALNNRPRNQVTLSLDYQTPFDLGIIVIARWLSDQASYETDPDTNALVNKYVTPAYANLDLKFNQAMGAGVNLYGGIDNILGEQRDFNFDQLDQRPIEGRTVYFGLQYDF